jgi:hypothetical protein
MERRICGADPIDMTSAAQRLDTGANAQRVLPADVTSLLPHDCETRDGARYHVRAIVPDDAERQRRFMKGLSDSSRVAGLSHEPSDGLLNRLVRIDYRREMALVAVVGEGPAQIIIGVARYGGSPAFCELAIAVADEWQARGVHTRAIAVPACEDSRRAATLLPNRGQQLADVETRRPLADDTAQVVRRRCHCRGVADALVCASLWSRRCGIAAD